MPNKPTAAQRLLLALKGMAMGAADVVPGVSGGTIAFITGIYEPLLEALRRWTPGALVLWRNEGTAAFWQHVRGGFLLTLFGGVLLSIFSLANLVDYALNAQPLLVWGFFFGLVLASIVYIGRQLPLGRPAIWLCLAAGTAVALAISLGRPVQLPVNGLTLFLGGSIAICAMILPGVSGSFLLLMMGLYPVFIRAVSELQWGLLATFLAGCVVGLLSFSHFLGWLLHRYRDRTMAVLTGFLVGSLNVIWPWAHTVETYVDRHGEQAPLVEVNVWPWDYAQLTGQSPQTLWVLLMGAAGLALVLGLEGWAARRQSYKERA